MIDDHISRIIEMAEQIGTAKNLWVKRRIELAYKIKQEAIELHLELMGPDVEIPKIAK